MMPEVITVNLSCANVCKKRKTSIVVFLDINPIANLVQLAHANFGDIPDTGALSSVMTLDQRFHKADIQVNAALYIKYDPDGNDSVGPTYWWIDVYYDDHSSQRFSPTNCPFVLDNAANLFIGQLGPPGPIPIDAKDAELAKRARPTDEELRHAITPRPS